MDESKHCSKQPIRALSGLDDEQCIPVDCRRERRMDEGYCFISKKGESGSE